MVSHDRNRNPGRMVTGGLDKVRGLREREKVASNFDIDVFEFKSPLHFIGLTD